MIYFVSNGFPYKDQSEQLGLFIVVVSLCVFLTSNIFNSVVNFNF